MRILHHRTLARKFYRSARNETPPDIIHCSLPTLELSALATRFASKRNIPIVLDIRDLWPEIMVQVFPSWAKPAARLLLWPMFWSRKKSCARASAISGITQAFVQKGLWYAGRAANPFDRDFPHGYPNKKPDESSIRAAYEFWKALGIEPNDYRFVVCYFGGFTRRSELHTVIRSACRLYELGRDIRFVICGTGEILEQCKQWARGCGNVLFPGWVGSAEIWTLMQMSSVGVEPYPSDEDFVASIPNKAIEYLAGGLPIVSSVKGVLEDMLAKQDCGVTYENENHEQLASIISDLYENPARVRKMSRNASAIFQEKFMAEKVYADMSEYLEALAEEYGRETGQ
jgi:glycosyltransferase involved in cell wall biosynthesis